MLTAAQMICLGKESRCLLWLAIQATALPQLQMQQSTINEGLNNMTAQIGYGLEIGRKVKGGASGRF